MSLPRNLIRKRSRANNAQITENRWKDVICQKHQLAKLSFNGCLLVDTKGQMTEIECKTVVGNMRHCILWVEAKNDNVLEGEYDLTLLSNENESARLFTEILNNKYRRHFMEDVQKKFKFNRLMDIRYVQLKVNTTPLVADDVKVYQMNHHYLIMGSFSIKTKYIDTFYPSKEGEQLLRTQEEFMNQMTTNDTPQID